MDKDFESAGRGQAWALRHDVGLTLYSEGYAKLLQGFEHEAAQLGFCCGKVNSTALRRLRGRSLGSERIRADCKLSFFFFF